MQNSAYNLGLIAAGILGVVLAGEQRPAAVQNDRVVWAGGAGQVEDASISPDGRFITYVDLLTRELHVRDLQTNQSRQISRIAAASGEVVESAISPDNKLVAVASRVPGEGWGVRILPLDTASTAPPRLLLKGEGVPLQWTSDSQRLLVSMPAPQAYNVGIVNVVDGAFQSLKTVSLRSNPNLPFAALSPDGSLLAFDTHEAKPERHRSMFCAGAENGCAEAEDGAHRV